MRNVIINFQTLLYALQTILLFRPYTRKFRGRNTLEIEADCWQDSLCSRDARYMYAMSQLRSSLFSETCQKYEYEGRAIIRNLCLYRFVASVSLSRKLNICLIIPHFSSSFSLPSNFNSSSFSRLKFQAKFFFYTNYRDTFILFSQIKSWKMWNRFIFLDSIPSFFTYYYR